MEPGKISAGSLWALPKANKDRSTLDEYWTPAYATQALLERETFPPHILEPACGAGHISKVLLNSGYTVESTDLRDPTLYGSSGVDFLDRTEPVASIITNPPYALTSPFIQHISDMTLEKSAMFLRLSSLISRSRFQLWSQIKSVRIYAFTGPVNKYVDGQWSHGTAFTHIWLVVDKTIPEMPAEFHWIDIEVGKHKPNDPPCSEKYGWSGV